MRPNALPLQHLRAVAEAEQARYRELCSVTAERLRQYYELNDRYPPGLAEIVGRETLRQLFAASDRLEHARRAIEYADGGPR